MGSLPQWTLVALQTAFMIWVAFNDGKMVRVDLGKAMIAWIILFTVLSWGGFFRG